MVNSKISDILLNVHLNLSCIRPAPKDEDEMMVAIFECIDRLFGIVRPRKVGKTFKQIKR